jgi:hypothetical protein
MVSTLFPQAGFVFHHAKAEYVMLKQWLAAGEAESLPGYASQYLGCAGLVLNAQQQVLVVQERFMKDKHWKLPGGLAEPGITRLAYQGPVFLKRLR